MIIKNNNRIKAEEKYIQEENLKLLLNSIEDLNIMELRIALRESINYILKNGN